MSIKNAKYLALRPFSTQLNKSYSIAMTDEDEYKLMILERRLKNLEVAIKEAGSATKLAAAAGTDPAYLSQLRTRRKTPKGKQRGIGDDLARKIEKGMGKELGWMDVDHSKDDDATEQVRPIPVIGQVLIAEGNASGDASAMDYEIKKIDGWIKPICKDPDAYAVHVQGHGLEDRVHSGEYLIIEPNHPVEPGDDVEIVTKEGEWMVKRYLYEKSGSIYLANINNNHRMTSMNKNAIETLNYVGPIVKPDWFESE